MRIRSDIIDVYVFRRDPQRPTDPAAVEFLQLLRANTAAALPATWQPVMGHIENDESAPRCAERELREELALDLNSPAAVGFWALQGVHPFYVAAADAIILSPRFALEVTRDWQPRLNAEHTNHRWINTHDIDTHFMWPGQRAACREILDTLLDPSNPAAAITRIA